MGRSRSRQRRSDRHDRGHRRRRSRSREDRSPSRDRQGRGRARREGGTTPEKQRDDRCCLRIGVAAPPGCGTSSVVTRDQVMNEMHNVKLDSKVSHIAFEPASAEHKQFAWVRVYFETPEEADEAITELNAPGRLSRWRYFVTQRLPLTGPFTDISGDLAFQPHIEDPPDTIVADTAEGLVFFGTGELYHTKGLDDCFQAKRQGKMIRRLICRHFDPHKKQACRHGDGCQFLHAKPACMNRLLRTVSHRQALRITRADDATQMSSWENERREDSLIVRDLDPSLDVAGLRYMFEGCAGFADVFRHTLGDGGRVYGVVRFGSPAAAAAALLQTIGSGLNVSFFGALEDLRVLLVREMKANPDGEFEYRQHLLEQGRKFEPVHGASGRRSESSSDDDDNNSGSGGAATNDGGGDRVVAAPVAASVVVGGCDAATHDASTAEGPTESALPASAGPTNADSVAAAPPRPASDASAVPFPPLPEGWAFGLSRRNNQYYFYQLNSKSATSWKHPVTIEAYTAPIGGR